MGLAMSDPPGRPIAFFLPTLVAGGAERVVVNLVEGMTERGVPVDLVVGRAEGELRDQLSPGVRLVDLAAPRVRRSVPRLSAYLRRTRPRALISAIGHANMAALLAARLAGRGTPVMVTVHSTLSQSPPRGGPLRVWVWSVLLHAFYRRATWVVAVSRGAADDFARLARLPRDRIQVVYNPVITPGVIALAGRVPSHPWFQAGAPPVILGVGRLTRAKDFPTLLRAFAEVRRRRPARLMIVGEGEERPALEALAEQLGITADLALPGFRADAVSFMGRAAVFVLSSAWEGLPTVLIEALAAGARVVATDCHSGPREILQEGRLGDLVPVGDAPALAQAILRALDAPRVPVEPDTLHPFTQEAAIDRYLQLLERRA